MFTGDAPLILDLLDRQFSLIRGQTERRQLLMLPRLLNFLASDQRLFHVLRDIVAEADRDRAEYMAEQSATRATMARLWDAHSASLLRILTQREESETLVFAINPERFSRALAEPIRCPNLDNWDLSSAEDESGRLVDVFQHYVRTVLDLLPRPEMPEATSVPTAVGMVGRRLPWLELEKELANESRKQAHSYRKLSIAQQTKGAFAWIRLARVADRVNPDPVTRDKLENDPQGMLIWLLFNRAEQFASALHEPDISNPEGVQHVQRAVATLQVDLDLLHDEVRTRIVLGASHRSVVAHYAARCEMFDFDRLRAICDADPGRAEAHLTLDVARHLFEQGFAPIIDPNIGRVKPDILTPHSTGATYVEAKQYSAASRSPRAHLVAGYRQVWSTWSQLCHQFNIPEAFILVFRRSGPFVKLPRELHCDDRVLYSEVVDISEETGSREGSNAIELSPEELLPEAAKQSEDTAE